MCATNRELDFPASEFARFMQFFPFPPEYGVGGGDVGVFSRICIN